MANYQSKGVGVIIARFQAPDLTAGHQELIRSVQSKHKQVLVFLGVSPVLGSDRNPLDFATRKQMVNNAYPDVLVLPLMDQRDDITWSKLIDNTLRAIFPTEKITLYGGRDSCLPHYKGRHTTEEIATKLSVSATELRAQYSEVPINSSAFRAGVVYGTSRQYPRAFPCVDVAVMAEDGKSVCLVRRPGATQWGFVGGFVDPTDPKLEFAAKREVYEETTLEAGDFKYITSRQVDDWRYRNETSKIMTTFFRATYMFGKPEGKDDVEEARFFSLADLKANKNIIHNSHLPLLEELLNYESTDAS